MYSLKLKLFILITVVYSAELLTDFSYTNFTVSYTDALDRRRVHLNIILLVFIFSTFKFPVSANCDVLGWLWKSSVINMTVEEQTGKQKRN